MIDRKEILRHFLANVFTTTNFEILNSDIPLELRSKLQQLVGVASMIITYEDFFLGKPVDLFRSDVDLKEICDIAVVINEDFAEENNVDLSHSVAEYSINVDRHFFGDAMNKIVTFLIKNSSFVGIGFDEKNEEIRIKYDISEIEILEKRELMEVLDRNRSGDGSIPYQVALEILVLHKMRIDISCEEMIISL